MESPPSIAAALDWGEQQCGQIGDSGRLDSEILLAFALGKPRSHLFAWPEKLLSKAEWQSFNQLVTERQKPTPVAYLVGEREFYSLPMYTTPATLVPRPETELLVDRTLEALREQPEARVLDLGTGTGAIALALKHERPGLLITATDYNPDTLAIAKRNGQRLNLAIDWQQSDWYAALETEHLYDAIVSNPPYIAASDPYLLRGDLPAEPQAALSPGESGLEALKKIIDGASDFLRPGGTLLLEHGYDQREAVDQLFDQRGFVDIRCYTDFNNLPRVSCAILPS